MTEIFSIDLIRLDGGTQSRAQIDQITVDAYAESIRNDAVFPPVVVFYDGKEYWLADGFHRVQAYKQEGCVTIGADIRSGTRREAILYSVGANAKHGLRRSNADKRRAVETLLRDEEWSKKSDRWIAEKCGVSYMTVARHREELPQSDTSTRTGQDGKEYPVKPKRREPAQGGGEQSQSYSTGTPENKPREVGNNEPHPALARQRSAPPVELPDEPDLDLDDELVVDAPMSAPADDANPYDETWIDDTIRGVMRVPAALVDPLVTRLMNAIAARGVYLTRDAR